MTNYSWNKRQPRKFRGKPQFTLDQLYITPFTSRRRYDEDGGIHFDKVERNLHPTGIDVMDRYVEQLAAGTDQGTELCHSLGLKTEDLDSFIFTLTGMPRADFRLAYQLRLADDLLRYTDMPIKDVARRCGLGSHTNLCVIIRRELKQTPTERRRALRQPNDEGRFRL